MRIALVGATGRIGSRTVEVLGRAGQQTVASAAAKASTTTRGKGLTAALTGVDAVVDASSSNAIEHDEAVAFFSASTRDLLVAEAQTGVSHHVLPSIVGIARCAGNAHTA